MDDDASRPQDPRHAERVRLVQELYSYAYDPRFVHESSKEHGDHFAQIVSHLSQIDALITQHAPKYPLDQIARADLAILRLALYELMIEKKEPPKVVINEAVELAKEMGSDRSFAFVNAVLGAVVSEESQSTEHWRIAKS